MDPKTPTNPNIPNNSVNSDPPAPPVIPPIEEAPHTPEHALPTINVSAAPPISPPAPPEIPPTTPTSPPSDNSIFNESSKPKSKFNSKIIAAVAVVLFLVISIPVGIFLVNRNQNIEEDAAPSQTYDIGYYINLAGGGSDPNGNIGAYNDEADCQPSAGVCFARNKNTGQAYPEGHVQKYICQGKYTNCDNTNAPGKVIKGPDYSTVHYIKDINYAPIQCDQTIQLDVFDKVNGTLKGFMVWYSGACTTTPTPVASPSPSPRISPSPSPRLSPTPVVSPVLSPTPASSPRVSPSPSASPSPTQSPVGGVASPIPSPTPKISPTPTIKASSPSPSPESLPVSGSSYPGIIAAAGGMLLLIVGVLLAF